ncbi:MAG TPA: FHA domain-containing protein [Planctomycetota bacterium]|nr:FHA domain-containing protein [Planctomycetota bacterium]
MITVLVRQGDQPEVEVNVSGDSATVGRAPGSQIHLTPTYVSKKHLRLLKGIVIVDLGSANGTFLDGKRLKDPVVYTGGELRIGDGDVFLRVRLDESDMLSDGATLIAVPASAVPAVEVRPEPGPERGEIEKLNRLLAEAHERIRALETERAAPPPPAGPAPELLEARAALENAEVELERAKAESESLRAQVATLRAESKPAVPASPAAELFLRLQSENSTLKRKLAEFSAKTPNAPPVPATDLKTAKLLAEIVELKAQNSALRAKGGASPPETSNVRALFVRLAKDDVDRQAPLLTGSVEEFLVLEHFRLVRTVERIVTRIAADAIELFDGKTMLPQLQGETAGAVRINLRQLITRLDDPAQDSEARRELVSYCGKLSRWLVASLGAERKAAKAFAHQIKSDLSVDALTSRTPIPALKRLSGRSEAELWRRGSVYLRELTPDLIQDRLEKLTRAAVLEFVGEESTSTSAESAR